MSSFWPTSGSGGFNFVSGSSTQARLARDLALIESRRRRREALNLSANPKDRKNSWFFDRFIPNDVERAANQIADSLIYTVPGLVQMGKGAALDVQDLLTKGDYTPERLGTMGKLMGESIVKDFQQPRENIGYLLMDAFALGSLGLGSATRIGRAAGVAAQAGRGGRLAETVARAATMPNTTTGALFHAVPPHMRPNFGKLIPKGLQSETAAEVSRAVPSEPMGNPIKAGLAYVGRWRARNQLKDMEQMIASRPPGYNRPSLFEQQQLAELRRQAGATVDVYDTNVTSTIPEHVRARTAAREQALAAAAQQPLAPPALSPYDAATRSQVYQEMRAIDRRMRESDLQAQRAAEAATAGRAAGYEQLQARARGARENRAAIQERIAQTREGMAVYSGLAEPTPAAPPVFKVRAKGTGTRTVTPSEVVQASQALPRAPRAAGAAAPKGLMEALTALNERLTGLSADIKQMRGDPWENLSEAEKIYMNTGKTPEQLLEHVDPIKAADAGEGPRGYGKPQASYESLVKRYMPAIGTSTRQMTAEAITKDSWAIMEGRTQRATVERAVRLESENQPTTRLVNEGGVKRREYLYDVSLGPRDVRSFWAKSDEAAKYTARRIAAEKKVIGFTERGVKRQPPRQVPKGKAKGKGKAASTATLVKTHDLTAEPKKPLTPIEEAQLPEMTGKQASELTKKTEAQTKRLARRKRKAAERMKLAEIEKKAQTRQPLTDSELDTVVDMTTPPAKTSETAKVAKKAREGKKITPDDVAKLNEALPHEMKNLGVRYNAKGFLSTGDDIEAAIEKLGFDPGDSFLIADALNTAAGQVSAGSKFTMSKFLAELKKNYPEASDYEQVVNKLLGGQGGAPGSDVFKGMLKAFFGPAPRVRGRLEAQLPARDEATGRRIFARTSVENIPLSNSPLVRAAWYTTYGFLQALENPYARGGRGNFASRQLQRKIAFERRELKRIVSAADAAGVTKAAREYEHAVEQLSTTERIGRGAVGALDSVNKAQVMGILFLKPSYLSANLIGQLMLATIDHHLNPIAIYRSVKLQRELYKDGSLAGFRAARIKRAMGEGMSSLYTDEPGIWRGLERAHGKLSGWYSKILDTPWRDNAFINEAIRQGFDTPEKLGKLVDATEGTKLYDDFVDVARRANRNMIDYGRMSPKEKQLWRRILIFYPWMKGATIYGARFAAEHPAQFLASVQMGRLGQEQALQDLGQVPSYLQGVFKTGERNVPGLGVMPKVFNPAAASILGTPGESLQLARGMLLGNVRQSEQLSESLTPGLNAVLAGVTRTQPFTGAKYPSSMSALQIAFDQLSKSPAPVRWWEQRKKADAIASGQLDPRETLYPVNRQEATARFLGPGFAAAVGDPTASYALNTREAQSRAQSEIRSLESRTDNKVALFKSYRDRAREEAKRVGVKLPASFDKALALKGQREAEIAAWEVSSGRKADSFDRLTADLRLLVKRKVYTSSQAKEILKTMETVDDSSIDLFRRKLGDAYFGGQERSYYKKLLTLAGAQVDNF